LALVCAAYAIPVAYAYGGVIFPWYLLPSAWIAQAITLFSFLRWTARHASAIGLKLAYGFIGISVLFAMALRLAVSYNTGTQAYQYLASVGRHIASVASPSDTLFLEPAGYIPFFAGLKTWDDVGLVSPDVLPFKVSNPDNWWPTFVMAKRPTWIVQRPDLVDAATTYQGYTLSNEERAWLFTHYKVVKRFAYVSDTYATSWLGRKILSKGTACGYDVLRLIPSTTLNP
jgi:hypothetical protein